MNADQETEIQPVAEVEAVQEEVQEVKPVKPVQPRIDELTRKHRESEREAAYWRQRAEAAEKPAEAAKTKPTPDQFADYGEFVDALADFKADEKIEAKLGERDKQAAAKQAADTKATNWAEREAQVKAVMPDYDEVMQGSEVPVAQHVIDLLLDSEEGPRVAIHLAKNPDLADKLNAMTPLQAAKEIGRLEERVAVPAPPAPEAAAEEIPAAPAVKKTTSAPPPAKPVVSGRSNTVSLDKMGMDEYVATRKQQKASWARR